MLRRGVLARPIPRLALYCLRSTRRCESPVGSLIGGRCTLGRDRPVHSRAVGACWFAPLPQISRTLSSGPESFEPSTEKVNYSDAGSDVVGDRSHLEAETRRLLDLMNAVLFSPKDTSPAVEEELSRTEKSAFDRAMFGWSKRREEFPEEDGVAAAERAEALLNALESNHDRLLQEESESHGGSGAAVGWAMATSGHGRLLSLIPNVVSYNHVLHAWASSGGGRDAAERAQAIVERMLRRCRDYSTGRAGRGNFGGSVGNISPPPEPSTISLNTVINAWAKSGDISAGRRAEEVFRSIEFWSHDCEKRSEIVGGKSIYRGCKANVRSFNAIIDAWSNSRAGASGADRAKVILDLFIQKVHSSIILNDAVLWPDVIFFNSVIKTIAKSGQGARGADMAEGVLHSMEELQKSDVLDRGSDGKFNLKPNTRTFTLILDCWANSALEGENSLFAARRAEEILARMEELYNKEGFDVKPNAISYTTCITAWARCRRFGGAAEHAEAILSRMLKLYESSGEEEIKPDTSAFNSVISAWARSGRSDGAYRAEAVLERLAGFGTADTTSYNAVIDSLAKSHERGGGAKAIVLLEQMESSGVKPDLITYNTTIDALSKDGGDDSAHRADLLLQKLEGLADNVSASSPGLDNRSFTSCINAYSRSNDRRKAEKARNVLQRLIDRSSGRNHDVCPDVFAYSACINACANTNGNISDKQDALKIAIQTFEEFKRTPQFGRPNAFTYGAMLKACSRLSSDTAERGRLLENMFGECCQEGFVSQRNLDLFRRNAPCSIRDKFLGDGSSLVPLQWCRHVRNSDRPSNFRR